MKYLSAMLLVLFSASWANGASSAFTEGAWVSQEKPQVRVEVNSAISGVQVTIEPPDQVPAAVEIVFYELNGKSKHLVIKALRPEQHAGRYFKRLNKFEPFVRFQVIIPFFTQQKLILESKNMLEVEE